MNLKLFNNKFNASIIFGLMAIISNTILLIHTGVERYALSQDLSHEYGASSKQTTYLPIIESLHFIHPIVDATPTITHSFKSTSTNTPTKTSDIPFTATFTPSENPIPTPTFIKTPTPFRTSTPTYLPSATSTLAPSPAPTQKIGYFSMIASGKECIDPYTDGLRFEGTASLNIFGGDIYSNACIVVNNTEVILEVPYKPYCVGENCYAQNGGGGIEPPPIPVDIPLDISLLGIPQPNCENLPFKGSHTGGGTIHPGIYTSIRVRNSDYLIMTAGLYCVEYDFIILDGVVEGKKVTIYMENGDFLTSGASSINLSAPLYVNEPEDGVIDVLIYFGNASTVVLQGSGNGTYSGTVYSPGPNSQIILGGASNMDPYNVQLIGGSIRIAALFDINIKFDPQHGYPK